MFIYTAELMMQKQLNSGKKSDFALWLQRMYNRPPSAFEECLAIDLIFWINHRKHKEIQPFQKMFTFTKWKIYSTLFKLKAHLDRMLVRTSLCCYCIIFYFHSVFINMHSGRQQSLSHFVSVVSHLEPTVICHITLQPATA